MGVFVLDIVFFTEFKGIDGTRITDFRRLRKLGDQKMKGFIQKLKN